MGYVTIEKGQLKVWEYDVYQGYYCGICKSIARRFGQIPRMVLSYDCVFLAVLLSGLTEEKDVIKPEHCIIHPIEKKPAARGNRAIDYAADVMIILAYHKFLDDWKDDKSSAAFAGKTALLPAYRKLRGVYPALCEEIEAALGRLSFLEAEKSGSLDQTAEAFADIMAALFAGYEGDETGGECGGHETAGSGCDGHETSGVRKRILEQLGRGLGRWIYVIDALDDYEKDEKDGSYNPLIYRKNMLEGIDDLLYNYLAEISNAYDLLPMKKYGGIVENIIFMGIRRRTDLILAERKDNEQSI